MAGLAATANQDRVMAGIAMMLLAYLMFSGIDTSAKWLALSGLPALQLAFMRYFGHFAISLVLVGRADFSFRGFGSASIGLVILRGALLMGSTVLNFFAIRYLPLTLTSTILFSAPILVCILSGPLLGERVGVWRWSAIMLGFAGILIAIRPFDESFHPAAFLSLGGACCFALYSILTRKLSGVVAIDTMQFYAGLVGTAALAPFAFAEWQNPDTGLGWVLLFMLGILGWGGHQLLTRAHGYATASTLTPYGYSFILFLTLWSYLVFDHLPDKWTVTGAAVVIASGMIIWLRERRLAVQRSAASGPVG
jgi:drug/metabolite transporter (DMT)-like permease